MGISIQELLAHDFFQEFYVLAGRNGLHNEVQGITILDAPDGYRWTRGKELVLTNGYVLMQAPDTIREGFEMGSIQNSAGMMLKRERYIDKLPDDILALFDEHNIPLISMPFSIPYIDLMNQINTAVMNRTIRRLRILSNDIFQMSNLSYREKKIHQILAAVENDMDFPAMIYDFTEQKSFYSSDNFPRISKKYGLKDEDYWEPSRPHARHTLCDDIHMTRFRLVESLAPDQPRVSWISIPIRINDVIQAQFVVMESRELLDFYDEYSIRISYLVLHSVYEQIIAAQNVGQLGFENYINIALHEEDPESGKLAYQAKQYDIRTHAPYQAVLFTQTGEVDARHERKHFDQALRKTTGQKLDKLVFLEENEGLLFFDLGEREPRNRKQLAGLVDAFRKNLNERLPAARLTFAAGIDPVIPQVIRSTVEKYRRVLHMGGIMYPERKLFLYEDLGPLTWLDIPEEELQKLLQEFRSLTEDPKNLDLMRTLQIYLENNLNYSITAQKQFLHINTVRNRIDRIQSLVDIDWENAVDRLRIEILLRFLELE